MPYLILLLIFLCFGMTESKAQRRVWVDTDISSGKLKGDMDDALALLMLLRDPTVHIEGISLVHGVKHAEKVTHRLLGWYADGREIRVHVGADSYKEFGQRTDAIRALERALEQGPMMILALGPATNITTLLQLRPDLRPNVQAISFCAGRRPGMVFTPSGAKVRFSDYNFDLDTVAGRLLLQMDVPILLSGYDCSDSLFLSKADYRHMKKSDHKGDRWFYRNMSRWEWVWRSFLGVKGGFIPFDCSTVGALLHSDEFETETDIPAFVEMQQNDSPQLIRAAQKSYLLVQQGRAGAAVDYCHFTRPEFKQRLLRVLHDLPAE